MAMRGRLGQNALVRDDAGVVKFVNLTPQFAIGPQISADDFGLLRNAGFAAILNARPDNEQGTYMASAEAARLAGESGLGYAHCPAENHAIFETDIIDRFEEALVDLAKPIYAHCKTGTRAAILWALAASRHRPVEEVIATLRAAGQDLDFLEQELRDVAKAERRSPLQLREDALLAFGRSPLMGGRREDPDRS